MRIISVVVVLLVVWSVAFGSRETHGSLRQAQYQAGKKFDVGSLPPEVRQAVEEGIADAWKEFDEFKKTEIVHSL
jgi:hypothetical protein